MNGNNAKIINVLTSEYCDFLDYCEQSGKVYIQDLTNADFIAFRVSRGVTREYISNLRKHINNYETPVCNHSVNLIRENKNPDFDIVDEQRSNTDNQIIEHTKVIDACEVCENIKHNNKISDNVISEIRHKQNETTSCNKDENLVDIGVFITIEDIIRKNWCDKPLSECLDININYASKYSINYIEFSVRAMNCLVASKCKLLSDILCLSLNQLKTIKNMGDKSVSEIVFKLQEFFANVKLKLISSGKLNVSKEFRVAIKKLVDAGERNPFLSFDDEKNLFKECEEAFNILGPEISSSAIKGDTVIFDLMNMLYAYVNSHDQQKRTFNMIKSNIECLHISVSRKKILPFIFACSVSTGKKMVQLFKVCNDSTIVFQLPNLIMKNTNIEGYEQLLDEAKFVLEWLLFDVKKIVAELSDKLQDKYKGKNSKLLKVVLLRNTGKSLEEIGMSMSITRERVRQLEKKSNSLFWSMYEYQKYDILMIVYALYEGKSIICYDNVKKILGDFSSILWIFIKKSPKHAYYEYSKTIDALVFNTNKDGFSAEDINFNIEHIIKELPSIFNVDQLDSLVDYYSKKNNIPYEIIKKEIDDKYQQSGQFLHRGRISVVYMCSYILKSRFPSGYKTADEYEYNRFKQYLGEYFGLQACNMTARAIDVKIMEIGCLCDRGKYIHPDYLQVDDSILQIIYNYIASSPRRILSYSEVYEALTDDFAETQIYNKYLLQGVLKKYGCKYQTNRDYILKEDGISFADELDSFVEQYGIIHKNEIFAHFTSIDDVRLGQVISRCPNVYSLDNGYYIHASLFDIRPGDYGILREYLTQACKDIPVNIRTVYEECNIRFPQFMIRNDFDDRNKLFAALNHMFKNDFQFSRPYIAKVGMGEVSNRSVILQYLIDYDSIEIDELIDICEINNINYVCLSYLCQLISPEFIRVDKDHFMRSEVVGVDDEIISRVSEIISDQLQYRDYIVASSFEDYIWMPDLFLDWNCFLLESIVLQNKEISTVFLIGNPFVHPNTVFVSNKYKNDTFVTMVLKILKEKVSLGYFNTKKEIQEWLLEEKLIEGKLPKVLEDTQYFYVSESGVQYTGKEIE